MQVAVGQFAAAADWRKNAGTCVMMMARAAGQGCSLLVLPEALLARDDNDPALSVRSAQALDGGFIRLLLRESRRNLMTTIFTLYVPAPTGRVTNTLVALRGGEVITHYDKLHLYDAFAVQESKHVDAGQCIAPLLEVDGIRIGLMTCYDLRFPELALALALRGAQVLALPAAWLRGPLKEHHWATLLAARALDTTCYLLAAGECGNKNIGQSRIVDPFGVTVAAAAESMALLVAEIEPARIRQVRTLLPVLGNRRFAPPQLL